jgi:PAS domain S-box-containing protein
LLFDLYAVHQHLQLSRLRRQIAERDQLFRLISENAADMIAFVDSKGRWLYNSSSYEKVLGYSSEDSTVTSALERIHPDDRPLVLEAAEKARLTGGDKGENTGFGTKAGPGALWSRQPV